ncbi:MFS transporter [Actinomadura sp. 3N407]|uniref:MFS transporter n=1 Tax=Actinomadura sp. 3N407 TaxID=3457423 RepID=UPI003FCDD26E
MPQRTDWLVIAATGIAVFMAQVDTTAVNIALPTVENEFAIGTSLTQWIVLGYVLPMIALSLPSGRWLDGVGHRNALLFAVSGFVLTSMAVGLAPSIGWLIAARVLQGAFAAVLFALIPVLTTVASRPGQRGRAMGIVMTLGPLGGVSGPVLGGLLVEHAGWQWIFYLNVPVGLIVIAIGLTRLPPGSALRVPGRGFLAEIGLLAMTAIALMLSLTFTAEYGPGWLMLAPLALPFALLWHRHPSSGAVRELLRAPGMRGPHLVLLTEMTAVMTIAFLVPFHLQRSAGATPADVGLTMLTFPLATMTFGLIGGALADRFTPRRVTGVGAVLITLGVALTVPLAQTWGMSDLIWRLAIIGVGAGLLAGPNQTMAMNNSPRHLLGTTGASTSLVRQIGIAFGPALATTLWALPGYTVTGMRLAIGMAAVSAALSVLALVRTPQLDARADGGD